METRWLIYSIETSIVRNSAPTLKFGLCGLSDLLRKADLKALVEIVRWQRKATLLRKEKITDKKGR